MKDAAAREHTDTETDATGHGLRVPFSGDGSGRGFHQASLEEPRRARAARGRIAKLVAAKLALDLLFVGGFALYTRAVTFGRDFDGALEHADGRGARGWVVDLERPGEPVEIQLFENGRFVASTIAEELRTDTDTTTTHGEGRRGFTFRFERDIYGDHTVSVYAVRTGRGGERRMLQAVGEPINFAWK